MCLKAIAVFGVLISSWSCFSSSWRHFTALFIGSIKYPVVCWVQFSMLLLHNIKTQAARDLLNELFIASRRKGESYFIHDVVKKDKILVRKWNGTTAITLLPNGQNIQVPVITIKWLLCFIMDSFISLDQDLLVVVKILGHFPS